MAYAGRGLILRIGLTPIAGVKQKSLSWAGNLIETTNGDSAGRQKFLKGAMGTESLEVSVEGVTEDDVLKNMALNTALPANRFITNFSILYPDGDTIASGPSAADDFVAITAFQSTGAHDDALTFSATFKFSGVWVYTAA